MIAIVALHLHQRPTPRIDRSTSRIVERTDSLIIMKDQLSLGRMCRDGSVPAFQPRNSARGSAPKLLHPLGVSLSAQSHIRRGHSARRLAHSWWYRVSTVRWLGSPDPSLNSSAHRSVYWLKLWQRVHVCSPLRRKCLFLVWYINPASGNRVSMWDVEPHCIRTLEYAKIVSQACSPQFCDLHNFTSLILLDHGDIFGISCVWPVDCDEWYVYRRRGELILHVDCL